MIKIKKTALLFSLPLFLVSCAQDTLTSDAYTRGQARGEQSVRTGKVVALRNIVIEGDGRGGEYVGGVAGGVLGNRVGGSSRARALGSVGGAIAGGILGSHVKKAAQTRQGIEITVRLDSGRTIAVAQESSPREQFRVGQRVRVIGAGGNTRVTY